MNNIFISNSYTFQYSKLITSLQNNLAFLYLLNLIDLLWTKLLLQFGDGLFTEINLFLNPLINGAAPYFLKIFLFLFVLFYWYKRSLSSTVKELKLSLNMSKICIGFYSLIILIHIFNTVFLILI